MAFDKNYIAATTCNPANLDNLLENDGNDEDEDTLFLFSLEQMKIVKTCKARPSALVVKLCYPDLAVAGHSDGFLRVWNLTEDSVKSFRAHTADILSLDLNMVSLSFYISFNKYTVLITSLVDLVQNIAAY